MFTFSLGELSEGDPTEVKEYPYRAWEEVYRDRWKWDKVTWGSHCLDCYPGNCPHRVYVKGDVVWREEQAGTLPVIEEGVPDMNPMGCQKGAGWSNMLYARERLLYPMKRVGERGSGQWQRISWDQALTEIADAMIDAIAEVGPESIISITGAEAGGWFTSRLFNHVGALATDVNAEINDFSTGLYITFGKFNPVSSVDDWFHSDLILIWHMNAVYTRIPFYHYIAEARYRGAEVITIAPDFSPSAVHADYYVSVKLGSDAALALAMSKVIIDEGLMDSAFVKEQTDLPLLVRLDNRRFLRGAEVTEGAREDQFYFYDQRSGRVVEAPRGNLALGNIDPALEGTYTATLKDGRQVEVTPVFELLKERLKDYEPEKAAPLCGVNPEVIRMLARKVGITKTNIMMGWNSCKYYHGDLMERSMSLALALTGNWGKKGAGIRSWSSGLFDGRMLFQNKRQPGAEATQEVLGALDRLKEALRAEDPTLTDEMVAIELAHRGGASREALSPAFRGMVPPVFFWYYHAGYRENWNNRQWGDPTMARSFDDYIREALDQGWWRGRDLPPANVPPRVAFNVGSNSLRRVRGGQTMLLKHLWPKLKMIVTIDCKVCTTGLYSDIQLPAANQYEKLGFHIPTPHVLNLTFSDRSVTPAGEAKSEYEIARLLAQKLQERAQARGFMEYKDSHGNPRRLDNVYEAVTMNRAFEDEEKAAEEWVHDSTIVGDVPEGTTLATLREKGFVRFVDWGVQPMGLNQATDISPNETMSPFRWHVEKKLPYPTLTRRAQFYIDHDWFIEAGEDLPTHKDPPSMGGDYPFAITSGHNRWSIHSNNIVNRLMLETHRGHPFIFMNPDDAQQRGIKDDEEVRIYNDMGYFIVRVKITPAVRPGQLILYNGWEPYLFRNWYGQADVEPGMVKWLHLVGNYGHLRHWPIQWQPVPVDRAVRVDVAKID